MASSKSNKTMMASNTKAAARPKTATPTKMVKKASVVATKGTTAVKAKVTTSKPATKMAVKPSTKAKSAKPSRRSTPKSK